MNDQDKILLSAYKRFEEKTSSGFDGSEYDEIAYALENFRMKHEPPYPVSGTISANRICAMLAVEAMYEWERMEWERQR